jgi:hypothetical protein
MDLDNLEGYYILNKIKPAYNKISFPYEIITKENFLLTYNKLEILIKEQEKLRDKKFRDKKRYFESYKKKSGGNDLSGGKIIIYEY